MNTQTVIFEGLRIVFGFFLVLFLPGFTISLVYFPRREDLSLIERLVYSTVLSIGSVMVLVLFMEFVLGVNTTPRNITLFICVLCGLALGLWWCERWYLKSQLKTRIDPLLSGNFERIQENDSRETNTAGDQFRQDSRTVVMYHEYHQSYLNHSDHSYLLDVGEEIDIKQVIKDTLNATDSVLVQPPYPRTRYFELVIREYNDDVLSLVDELQLYPVHVTKKPDRTFLGLLLKRGTTNITERIHKKSDTTEIQWIYSHDFPLFATIHTDDTLEQMVDRILGKLDEITLSINNGIKVSFPEEEWQIWRDTSDTVIETSRDDPIKSPEIAQRSKIHLKSEPRETPKHLEYQFSVIPVRKLQKEIVRDMDMFGITPDSFGKSKKNIENITIPNNSDINNKKLSYVEEELQDLDGHNE